MGPPGIIIGLGGALPPSSDDGFNLSFQAGTVVDGSLTVEGLLDFNFSFQAGSEREDEAVAAVVAGLLDLSFCFQAGSEEDTVVVEGVALSFCFQAGMDGVAGFCSALAFNFCFQAGTLDLDSPSFFLAAPHDKLAPLVEGGATGTLIVYCTCTVLQHCSTAPGTLMYAVCYD